MGVGVGVDGGLFFSSHLLKIIWFIVCTNRCIFKQKELLRKKSLMGFKILRSWRSGFSFFSKSQQVGQFLKFHTKLHVLSWFFPFLSKKTTIF